MPLADLGHVKLYYETEGKGEPLIFLAGFSNDVSWWHRTVSFLKPFFRVILLDYRGGGKSASTGPFSIRDLAHDTVKVMDLLHIQKASIVGWSMGGAVAQEIAAFFPDRVDRLCLLCSLSHLHPITNFVLRTGLKCREKGVPVDLAVDVSLPWGFSGSFFAHPQNIEEFKRFLFGISPGPTLEGLTYRLQAIQGFDSRPFLKKIQAKTLVIGTKRDLLVPLSDTEFLAKTIPHAKLHLIAEEGHYPPWECPEELAAAISTL